MRPKLTEQDYAEGWQDTDFSTYDAEGEIWRVQFSRRFDPVEYTMIQERVQQRAYDEDEKRWRMDRLLEIVKEVAPDVLVVRSRRRDQEAS